MASFFDAMILELKLDTSNFQKGAKDTESASKKIKETLASHAKDVEASSAKAANSINKLMKEFAGLFALLTAGKGVKQFVSDITQGDAALGRFAGTVSMSSKTIQGWQGAVESIGGSAADTATDIRMLSDQLQGLALSGDASKLATIGKIQALSGQRINLQANPAEQLEQYNRALHALYVRNPAQEGYLSRQLGITDADNQLLIMAPERVKKLRQEFEKFAASDQDIQAAEKRQDLWAILIKQSASLGRSLLTMLTPAILQVGRAIRDFMDKHGEDLKKWFADVGQAILNAPWKEWFDDIKAIATDIDWAVKGTLGWKNALLLLLGVQVLNWLSPVVAAFGLLNGFLLSIVGAGPALAALFATGGALAGLAALYGLVRPTPLNEGENEIERQKRYGQGGGAGAGAAPSGGAPSETGGGGAEGGGIIPGAHAAESNRKPKPGEFGTPWNHQTEGPPAPVSGGGSSGGGGASGRYGPQLPGGGKRALMGRGSATSGGVSPIGWWTQERIDHAVNKLVEGGVSKLGAQALVARWAHVESTARGPLAHNNIGGGHSGIAQWGPNRGGAAALGMTFDEQLQKAVDELHGSESRSLSMLNNAKTPREAAIGANQFERAEGYNPATGADNWVGKTLRGMTGTQNNSTPSETNAYVAPGANQGDASQAPGTAPGAGVRKSFNGQPYTDYYPAPTHASTPKLKDNMTTAEINAWNAAHGGAAAGNAWQKALHSLSRPHEHAKRLLQHISGNIPPVGAATSAAANATHNHHGPVNSHNSAETHVGAVHVNMPPGSDASAIARDIKPALERVKYSMQMNYSLA